jgi:hypothetical protein
MDIKNRAILQERSFRQNEMVLQGESGSLQQGTEEAVKEDNRGKHWKSKVADGNAPEPWKHTKCWADKRNALESEFEKFSAAQNIKFLLPWRRPSSTHRIMGNTNKALYIELMTHHFKKTAAFTFFENESIGFLGIKALYISAENKPIFDLGLIPSIDGKRRAESAAHIKTLIKIWHTAGFVERVLEGGALNYVFDQATFDRMRAQAQRAEEKRRAAKSALPTTQPSAASEERPTQSVSETQQPAPSTLSGPAVGVRLPPMVSLAAAQDPASAPHKSGGLLPPLAIATGHALEFRWTPATAAAEAESGSAAGASSRPNSLWGVGAPAPTAEMEALLQVVAGESSLSSRPPAATVAAPSEKRRAIVALEAGGGWDGREAEAAAGSPTKTRRIGDGGHTRAPDEGGGPGADTGCDRKSDWDRAVDVGGGRAGGEGEGPDGWASTLALAAAVAERARAQAAAAQARVVAAVAEARAAEAEARAAEAEVRVAEAEVRIMQVENRRRAAAEWSPGPEYAPAAMADK